MVTVCLPALPEMEYSFTPSAALAAGVSSVIKITPCAGGSQRPIGYSIKCQAFSLTGCTANCLLFREGYSCYVVILVVASCYGKSHQQTDEEPSQRKFVLFSSYSMFFVSSKLFLFKISFHRFRYRCMLPSRYSLLASSLLIHSMALAKVPTTLLPVPGTYSVKYWKMNCSQVL